jgi:hypothetical protein
MQKQSDCGAPSSNRNATDSKREAIRRHASLMCREMSNDYTAVAYNAGFTHMCGAGAELHDDRAIEMIVDHVNAGDEVLQIASGLRSQLSKRGLRGLQAVCLAGFDDSTLNTGIGVGKVAQQATREPPPPFPGLPFSRWLSRPPCRGSASRRDEAASSRRPAVRSTQLLLPRNFSISRATTRRSIRRGRGP